MKDARVLVAAGDAFWHRNIMKGFTQIALERGWTVVRYPSEYNLDWFIGEWQASAVLLSKPPLSYNPQSRPDVLTLALNWCPTDSIPSVSIDESHVGETAAEHLLAKGLRDFSSFFYSTEPFALARVRAFRAKVEAAGGRFHRSGIYDMDDLGARVPFERPDLIPAWLKSLPKPCGIFCACDAWARTTVCYCRAVGIQVPEDVAIVGVDNDPSECEQTLPQLSSVVVPWQEMGREAARLISRHLQGKDVAGQRIVVKAAGIAARRSSDITAIDDPEVATAVAWIRANAHRPVQVSDIADAVPTYRHRLERRFLAVLGRTIMQEVRLVRVEMAKRLLAMTALPMPDVAERSGFSSASLLSVTFHRETGVTPGEYRRSMLAGGEA